jgi:hypothetical protein
VFRSQGGPDTLDNLILLCGPCHDRAHGKGQRSTYEPLRRWELQYLVWADQWGATGYLYSDGPGAVALCLTCALRTEQYTCVLWEQDVTWDYRCEQWRSILDIET